MLIGGIMLPLIWSFKNHPNEYCYFNEMEGGINGAYGNFETDYWMNSTRESSQWLREQIVASSGKKPSWQPIVLNRFATISEMILRMWKSFMFATTQEAPKIGTMEFSIPASLISLN